MSTRKRKATKAAETTVTKSAKKKVASEREKSKDREEAFTIVTTTSDKIKCPVCARDSSITLIGLSIKELESHFKEEHENIRITWKCKACSNQNEYSTAHGLRVHAAHCTGEVKVEPVRVEPGLPFKCDECESYSFNTKLGLSQHLRHNHPDVLKAKKAERLKGRKGRLPCLVTEDEFAELMRLDKQYRGTKQINVKIREHFPQLTCKQISDLRRRLGDSPSSSGAEESKDEGEDAPESDSTDE